MTGASYEYRLSDGIVMRRPLRAPLVEAWNDREGRWFVYPDAYQDFIEASRPISEADVPEAALAAPSAWPPELGGEA